MDREEIKELREIEIFRRFVERSGIDVISNSVEHRPPPEPDILCRVRERGCIRFELTEACSREFSEAINNPRPVGSDSCFGADVTKETVLKKLGKSYPVPEPIELLVYTDGATGKPEHLLEYDITDALQEKEGPFSKVWLMGDEIHEYLPVRS
jgi:hypothetical protein